MLDFIKIKNFCSKKSSVKKIKRQSMDWRKCLQITYLEKTTTENTRRSLKANSGKTNNPVRKWLKDTETSLKKIYRCHVSQ